MRARLLLLTIFVAAGALHVPGQRTPRGPIQFVAGTWVVQGNFQTGGPAILSQRQIDSLRGTRVVYSAHSIRFGRRVLRNPTYTAQAYSERRFFVEFHVYCRELTICGEPIIVIEGAKDGGPGSDFPAQSVVWIDHDHLAAIYGGVFLKLVRSRERP